MLGWRHKALFERVGDNQFSMVVFEIDPITDAMSVCEIVREDIQPHSGRRMSRHLGQFENLEFVDWQLERSNIGRLTSKASIAQRIIDHLPPLQETSP